MIKMEDAVDWVLEHRRGKAFVKQTAHQIEWAICRAINCQGFASATDEKGRLLGLICATPNAVEKTLRVHEVLCIDPRALPSMALAFEKRFAGYGITAKRHGKDVIYRTKRLIHLLMGHQ